MPYNEDPCTCEEPDCQSCTEEAGIVDIPEPPCEVMQDLCDDTDELLDNLECCPVDTGIGTYVLSEADKITLKKRMAHNLVEQSRCGDRHGILVFDNCEDMARYTGDCLCPLTEGQLALVYNKATMCFELWTAFLQQSGANDVDCSDGQTMVSVCQTVIWRSYQKCHPNTDIYVTDNKLTISADGTIVSTITRSDGTTFKDTILLPAPEIPDTIAIYGNKELLLNKANQVGEVLTRLGDMMVAPADGVYHITGNVNVHLDCPTGSANGFFRWGTQIFVGGVIKQNNGYQGFAGNYKMIGQMYQASAQVGITIKLKKGDTVELKVFEYTPVGYKQPDKTDWNAQIQWHKI